ncbi:MAG: FAD-dependent oxidoreductase, partial [Spirochaetia bacterium]|nr:FAD-dependent oxidoreductase [Spirochaetia bacterium]
PTEVENSPGFPKGISGPELMVLLREQSIHSGARVVTETVDKVDFKSRPFKVYVGEQIHEAHTIILATGATAKRLHLPGEEKLWQRGISACAVCDGALPIFRNQPLAVVGGGDTAIEEASYLTKFASEVHLIHRRDELRASKVMQERAFKNPKMKFIWDTVPLDVEGDTKLRKLQLQNVKTKAKSELVVGGLFYAIGHTPNTAFLEGQLKTDEAGYLVTEPGTTRTSVAGVFAAGDVQDKVYRQAITSAGTGCMAALDAERYLAEHGVH